VCANRVLVRHTHRKRNRHREPDGRVGVLLTVESFAAASTARIYQLHDMGTRRLAQLDVPGTVRAETVGNQTGCSIRSFRTLYLVHAAVTRRPRTGL